MCAIDKMHCQQMDIQLEIGPDLAVNLGELIAVDLLDAPFCWLHTYATLCGSIRWQNWRGATSPV